MKSMTNNKLLPNFIDKQKTLSGAKSGGINCAIVPLCG